MGETLSKELKWKHSKSCCDSTDHPKKRNRVERFFNRYNHIMEFVRTILGVATITLQLIILYRLS